MATGISKAKWNDEVELIEHNVNQLESDVYTIQYAGKRAYDEIAQEKSKRKYTTMLERTKHEKTQIDNSIFYGDNADVLKYLIHEKELRGKVKLVYIDPPYGTNSVFQSRTQKDSYSDVLTGASYLEFIRERLILLRELLSDEGSIYVHLDYKMAFQVKVLMDEVFGVKNFKNFITRKKCSNKNSTVKQYGNIADYILFYSKTDKYTWSRATYDWTDEKMKKEYPCIEESTGRRFKKVPIHAPGTRNGETGKVWKGMKPPPGKHWQYTPTRLDEFEAKGEIYWSSTGNPRRKVYFNQDKGIAVQDVWLDVADSINQNIKITGYPTEKNPFLLERIIKASSNQGDIVVDCFAGSGTTLAVAEQLGRKFIGMDSSSEALDNILKRFIQGPQNMGDYVQEKKKDKSKKTTASLFDSLEDSNGKEAKRNKETILDFTLFVDKKETNGIGKVVEKWSRELRDEEPKENPITYLVEKDPVLQKVIEQIGDCKLRLREARFSYLFNAILGQQLSKSAADTIIGRVTQKFGDNITAEIIKEADEDELNSCGVSGRKISYLKSLADEVIDKRLVLEKLAQYEDYEVTDKLTGVKGIGVWTAKMFLIFVLGRPNVFPKEDVAFVNSIKALYGVKKEREVERHLSKLEKRWAPYASTAAWYMWAANNQQIQTA